MRIGIASSRSFAPNTLFGAVIGDLTAECGGGEYGHDAGASAALCSLECRYLTRVNTPVGLEFACLIHKTNKPNGSFKL